MIQPITLKTWQTLQLEAQNEVISKCAERINEILIAWKMNTLPIIVRYGEEDNNVSRREVVAEAYRLQGWSVSLGEEGYTFGEPIESMASFQAKQLAKVNFPLDEAL